LPTKSSLSGHWSFFTGTPEIRLDEQIPSVMAQLQKEVLSNPIGYSRNSEKACDSQQPQPQLRSEMLHPKLLAGKIFILSVFHSH
jgi:hypothetical protein